MTVQKHTALGEVLDGGGENIALNVAASVSQLLGAHSVADTHNVLLDDWPLIEVAGDKVGSGANDLHTAVVSLVVGLGTLEGRQETVVDVDDTAGHGLTQGWGENLHVAGQNDQIDFVLADKLQHL